MPRTPKTHSRASVLSAEPQLFVVDLAASLAFYERLGFSVAFRYGDPPFYAQVERGGAKLNLRLVDGPVLDPLRRAGESLLSATVTVSDAGSLYDEFASAGVEFAQMLREEPWGATTFIVRDPDGNLILFAA